MSDIAIKVENLGKLYRLGEVGTGTISHDLNRWWARVRGKEDPYATIGETNDRTAKGSSDYVWSLKDLNFEVKQGEVLCIIGRNGAGKSTLLKLLSKVTAPTTGRIKVKGRIASLLEVGTGFHPELTGRENIFLNGAILGMTKAEIRSKFDEIVDFAGVERYIDTPVKRYSSGMYVRLAFAVAAFLEPEILIVDEVLAVGDAEFQRKCLGRMKDVSVNDGRTVLFVSHNMTAVKSLCNKVLHLQYGQVEEEGDTTTIINNYLSKNLQESSLRQYFENFSNAPGNDNVRIKRFEIIPQGLAENSVITVNTPIRIEFEFWNQASVKAVNLSMGLFTIADEHIFQTVSEIALSDKGLYKGVCFIPAGLLNDGMYKINMMIVGDGPKVLFEYTSNGWFEVSDEREASAWHGKWPGFVRPKFDFILKKVSTNEYSFK